MKDCKIKYYDDNKCYYNENNQLHRLTGPAIEFKRGGREYFINDMFYMGYYIYCNKLIIYTQILKLNSEYEQYIKQNIKDELSSKDLIQECNSKILLSSFFTKEKINQLPDYVKDLIIL